MKAENLVNKKKLLAIIEKIGRAPWEMGEGVEKLIPLDAVMLAIESPAQAVSPAELAGILPNSRQASLKGKAWVLEGLKIWLRIWENSWNHKDAQLGGRTILNMAIEEIKILESQAPVSELANRAEAKGESDSCPVCKGKGQLRRPIAMRDCLACGGTGKIKKEKK